MANLIDISVRAADLTRAGFDSVQAGAARMRASMDDAFSRLNARTSAVGSRLGEMGNRVGEFGSRLAAVGARAAPAMNPIGIAIGGIVAGMAGASLATLAFGGAIAGVGIMAAMKAKQVQNAFGDMKANISKSLSELAKPLEPVLVNIAGMIEKTFNTLAPSLGGAFEAMAPAIEGFVSKISVGMESFQGTITAVTAKFGPLIDALGTGLQRALEHVAEDFTMLAEVADPRFITVLVGAFTGLIDVLTLVVVGFSLAGSAIMDLINMIPGVNFDRATESTDELTSSTDDAVQAIGELSDAMREAANAQLGASGAILNFEASIDKASEAVAKNGRTLDTNTEKGRSNQSALNAIASSALQMGSSMEEAGFSSSEAMAKARAAFISASVKMGATSADAEAVATKFGLVKQSVAAIPPTKGVKIIENAAKAQAATDQFRNRLLGIPNKNVTVRAFVGQAESALWSVRARLAAINSKTVSVRVNYYGTGDAALRAKYAHGGIIGAAGGGPRSGAVWVGEQGPELVSLPTGSTVHSAGDSKRMASGMGSGGVGKIQLEWVGGNAGDSFMTWLKQNIRATAGSGPNSVQTALS